MTRTHFANPHGLDQPGHLSTARDVTRLLRAALAVPFIRRAAATERATIAGPRTIESTDNLLGDVPGIVGAKTGHTDDAGWSQVAMVRRDGVQVVVALLGAPNEATRDAGLARLLTWGLDRYARVRAVDARKVYARAEVGWSKPPVLLRARRTLIRPVALDVPLRQRVVAPHVLPLPVRAGQAVGEIRLYAGPRLVARAPLVADRSVERPGLLGRVGWYAGRAAHHVGEIFH
jgi:D-alanyl-D-alanine carboxypeptidase (penicillin-binding protein 5/6)